MQRSGANFWSGYFVDSRGIVDEYMRQYLHGARGKV